MSWTLYNHLRLKDKIKQNTNDVLFTNEYYKKSLKISRG